MGKIRTMGAGLGGSTAKNINVNANTGGGNKKQGLSTTTNKRVQFVSNAIKTRSYGEHRNFVFCMNQLGGVGAVGGGNGSRMFGTTSDGVKDCITGPYGCEQVVREAYLEAYGREPDKSGLRTYCIAMTKRKWSKADVIADLEKNEDSLAPIYASLAGDYLMEVYDGDDNFLIQGGNRRPVNIDSLGNITGSPTIGKITVNSETEYSLTMDEYGVTNATGYKYKFPVGSWGNMPKIEACYMYFEQTNPRRHVYFHKDSDKDGVDDFDDYFPLDPNETADADDDGVGDNSDVFPNDPNAADVEIDFDRNGIITSIIESALADENGAIQITNLYASGIIISGTNVDELFTESIIDTDGDGSITAIELTEGLSAATVSVIRKMIDKFDKNKDGVIESSPEFNNSVMKELNISGDRFITKFDTNGDNSLSTEELTVAAEELIIERIEQGIAVMNMASALTASGLADENGISLNSVYAAGLVRQGSRADQLLIGIVDSDTDGVVSATEMTKGLSTAFAVAAGELITQFGDDSGVIDPKSDNFGDFDTAVQEELNMTGTAFIAAYGGSDGVLDQGEIMSIALALLSEQLQGKLSTLSSWQTYKQVFESKREEINDDTSTTQEEKDELIAAAKLELFENIGCYDPSTSLDEMTKEELEELWLCQRMKEWDLNGDDIISFEEYKERMNRQNYSFRESLPESERENADLEAYYYYQGIAQPGYEFTVEDWLQLELRNIYNPNTGEGRHITREELLSALKSESTSSNIEINYDEGAGEGDDDDEDGDAFSQYEGSTIQETAQNIINAFGTDGVLNLSQLAAYFAEIDNTTIEEVGNVESDFAAIDTNDDGEIDVDELTTAFGGEDNEGEDDDGAVEAGDGGEAGGEAGDGVGDNTDVFPNDPTEPCDTSIPCGDCCEGENLLEMIDLTKCSLEYYDGDTNKNPDIKLYMKSEVEEPTLDVGGSTTQEEAGFLSTEVLQCENDQWVSIDGSAMWNGRDYRGYTFYRWGNRWINEWNYYADGASNANKLKFITKYIDSTGTLWTHTFYWKYNGTDQGEFYNCSPLPSEDDDREDHEGEDDDGAVEREEKVRREEQGSGSGNDLVVRENK